MSAMVVFRGSRCPGGRGANVRSRAVLYNRRTNNAENLIIAIQISNAGERRPVVCSRSITSRHRPASSPTCSSPSAVCTERKTSPFPAATKCRVSKTVFARFSENWDSFSTHKLCTFVHIAVRNIESEVLRLIPTTMYFVVTFEVALQCMH